MKGSIYIFYKVVDGVVVKEGGVIMFPFPLYFPSNQVFLEEST